MCGPTKVARSAPARLVELMKLFVHEPSQNSGCEKAMQLCTAVGATPRYALLADDNLPLGLSCAAIDGETCTAIYGFTNREAYDRFRGESWNPWRPYPLVSRHLKQMLTQPGLQLVVLDAFGPNEPTLAAGTAEAVLAAHVNGAQQLKVGFYLLRTHGVNTYSVERAPQ